MADRVRDLELARNAFDELDVDLTKDAHSSKESTHKSGGGGFLRSIIFGALDGIVTTFATIAGTAGASYGINVVVTLGFSALIADAISMGLGDYISSQSELDWSKKERRREEWEFQHIKSAEIEEMMHLYMEKGISEEDAKTILSTMAKYDQFFVDHMMVMELGIMPPDGDESPRKAGAVTFASFLVFGSIPLIAYLIFYNISFGADFQIYGTFIISAIITGLSLFALGVLKGRLAGSKAISSGIWVLFNGSLAAGAAFLVAYVFALAVPDECVEFREATEATIQAGNTTAGAVEKCVVETMQQLLETRSSIPDIAKFCGHES